jgi:hypothetical protein
MIDNSSENDDSTEKDDTSENDEISENEYVTKKKTKKMKKSNSLEFKKMKSIVDEMRGEVKKMKQTAMSKLDQELVSI